MTLGVQVDEFSWRRALLDRYDIWHLHWPESYPNKPAFGRAMRQSIGLLALLSWARARGARVVWTVHNLAAHERMHPRLSRWFLAAFLRRVDGVISLSALGDEQARLQLPRLRDVPRFIIPHGHYRGCYVNRLSRDEARNRLHLPAGVTVVAFMGQIRPYKNVPALISAFRALRNPRLRLLIAGMPGSTAAGEAVSQAAAGDDRIRVELGFLAENDLQLYLNAADLIVLPYRDVLNSGSAILALSFDRPVLVPRQGALAELKRQIDDTWVSTYEGALTPSILAHAVAWSQSPRSAEAPLGALEWTRVASATRCAYDRVLSERQSPGLSDSDGSLSHHHREAAACAPRP